MYSSPRPLLLQAKEGGVKHFAPLCRAERLKITRWAILAKEPACRAERGWGEFMCLYN